MTYTPGLNGGRINVTLGGNSTSAGAGYTLASTGTLTLAGGNNITLSQNGNVVTISGGAAASNTLGVSNIGNTVGTSGVISGSALQFAYAGGNNITLSQSINASSATITVSAPDYAYSGANGSATFKTLSLANSNGVSFSTGTQGLYATVATNYQSQGAYLTTARASTDGLGLNTAASNVTWTANSSGLSLDAQGYAGTGTSATNASLTLNSNGLAISVAAPGAGGGIALANTQTTYTSGTANLVVGGGAMTIASTTGQSFNFSVPQTSSLSGTGAISISTNGGTISLGAPYPAYSAANGSFTTGTAIFANSNGVSFSTGTQGIYAAHALQYTSATSAITSNALNTSVAKVANIVAATNNTGGGTSSLSGNVSFTNANNVTFYTSAGGAIAASINAGGGGVAIANSQTTYTSGTANLVASGALTIASTTGQSFNLSVPAVSSLSATGAVSLSSNGSTISIGVPIITQSIGMNTSTAGGGTGGTSGYVTGDDVQYNFYAGSNITLSQSVNGASGSMSIYGPSPSGGGVTGSYYDNMLQQNSAQAITYTSVSTGMFGRVIVQPIDPAADLFPFNMTVSTMYMDFSNSGSSAISAAHTSSWYVGLYTRVNSTQLSLVNSVSTSIGMAANANNSASYLGARYLSFHSSLFSAQPAMSADTRYFFAILARTSGASYASLSLAGAHYGQSVQRSGFMGAAVTSGTSFNAWNPFMGVHSLTTHTALPGSLANSDINKASNYANFIPRIIFNGGGGLIN